MPSPQKAKGSGYERQICEIFKETFGGNWQRVPNSGAFTGRSNAFRKETMDANQIRLMKGDVIPAAHMPHFVVECKFYGSFGFHQLLGENKQLDSWIEQTQISADPGDMWLLCIKVNRKGMFAVFDAGLKHEFYLKNHVIYKDFVFCELTDFITTNVHKILELTK